MKRRRPTIRTRSARGFTLIELMVTMMITATVFTAVGGILFQIINASEQVERKLRTEKAGYGVLTTLRRDLTGVYAYALGGLAFKGENQDVAGKAADELRFVTTARILPAEGGQPAPTLAEVGYLLREGDPPGSGLALYRRAVPYEGDPLAGGGDFVEIFAGVETFQLTYLDPEDKDWKEDWEKADALPLAVKIELELVVSEAEREAARMENVELPSAKFTAIVGLPVKAAPPADPAPEGGEGTPPPGG